MITLMESNMNNLLTVKQYTRAVELFIIVDETDNDMVSYLGCNVHGTKYIESAIAFYEKVDAMKWIKNHTYKGMTSKYRVQKIIYDYKELKRWIFA